MSLIEELSSFLILIFSSLSVRADSGRSESTDNDDNDKDKDNSILVLKI